VASFDDVEAGANQGPTQQPSQLGLVIDQKYPP
jgi:hypothetical protein